MSIALKFVYAYIATIGFAVLFQVPRKTLLRAGFAGAFGWSVFNIINQEFNSMVVATFLAAMVLAMIGERFARTEKQPFTVFIIPGIVPLVPGVALYNTMIAILEENYNLAIETGSEAILIALAISGGLTIVLSVNAYLRKKRMALAEIRAIKIQEKKNKLGNDKDVDPEEQQKEIEKTKLEQYYKEQFYDDEVQDFSSDEEEKRRP